MKEAIATGVRRSARIDIKSKRAIAEVKEAMNGANASKEPTRNGASVGISVGTRKHRQNGQQGRSPVRLSGAFSLRTEEPIRTLLQKKRLIERVVGAWVSFWVRPRSL